MSEVWGATLSPEGVVMSETGHIRITTPDGIIMVTRFPNIGTGISVYDSDSEPVATFHLRGQS